MLEDRSTPAWWTVAAPAPSEGMNGVTDASHVAELLPHPDELPDGNGGVLVEADTPEEAVTLAVSGTVSVDLGGETAEYTFGPGTAGTNPADGKPFLVTVAGGSATIALEDLVGFPNATNDWDYDDRTWSMEVVETNPPDELVDSGKYEWVHTWPHGESSVAVHFRVTSEEGGAYFRWRYRLVNNSVSLVPDHYDYLEYPGVHAFWLEEGKFDLSGADEFAATNGWAYEGGPYPQPLTWAVATWPDPGPGQLRIGQDATFSFRTPPRPVVEWGGGVEGDAEVSGPSGPLKGPGAVGVSIDVPKLIPVNANNDNGSPWVSSVQKFIPSRRDFDMEDLPVADMQLQPITVTATNTGPGGVVRMSSSSTGDGRVQFWEDRQKNRRLTSITVPANQKTFSKSFYIEGQHESVVELNDVKVAAEFTLGGGALAAKASELVSVTPVVQDFEFRNPSPKSVRFINGLNGVSGMQGRAPQGQPGHEPGIEFLATVVTDGAQSIKYLQNLTGVIGGEHTGQQTNADGKYKAAYIYSDRRRAAVGILPDSGAAFPVLDAEVGGTQDPANDPTYPTVVDPAADPDVPTRFKYYTQDSPTSGMNVPDADKLVAIDYRIKFTMYIVVRYNDGTLYPVANGMWDVVFYATNPQANQGVTTIDPASRVAGALLTFKPSNSPPEKTVPPVWNQKGVTGLFTWQVPPGP